MKILNLKLNNFRQFVGKQELIFANDETKNVTFILAPNRTGKTTIIEAFRYLFYGKTSYSDGIANIDLVQKLPIGEEYVISITSDIEYLNTIYTIKRKSTVRKNNNKINILGNFFTISYKDDDGVMKEFNENNASTLMKEIMPENLFEYFFFEGEEIENLGDNLFNSNQQQNAFASAIRNILGFTHVYNMREDLGRTIKKFNDELTQALDDDKENQMIARKKSNLLTELNKKEDERKKNVKENEEIEKILTNLNNKLLANVLTKEKQDQRNKKIKDSKALLSNIQKKQNEIFLTFSKNAWYLFASKLFNKSLETLKEEDKIDKGIPGLDDACIKYILEHKKCICGAEIVEGSSAYERLKDLENFIPPISIGTQINNFKNKIEDMNKNATLVCDKINLLRQDLKEMISASEKLEKEITLLDKELENTIDMREIAEQQKNVNADNKRLIAQIAQEDTEIKRLKQDIEVLDKQLSSMKPKNSRAQFLTKCIFYNKWLCNRLDRFINKKETEQKQKLEQEINSVYSKTFNSSRKISLQDDYSLRLIDNGEDITRLVTIDGSESTMLAFAFIGGVIESSKAAIADNNNKDKDNDNDIECINEPYPLVLDAPSSNLDKNRIKDFCEIIPNFAEQTIILIKDTDGDYVKQFLKNKIGKYYKFNRKKDYYTEIEEG